MPDSPVPSAKTTGWMTSRSEVSSMSQVGQGERRSKYAVAIKFAWVILCLVAMAGWTSALFWGAVRLAHLLIA